MQELSKFRIITVGFILMFIFAIAAMYSNTRDITAQKTKNAKLSEEQQFQPDFGFRKKQNTGNNQTLPDDEQFSRLEERVNQLENAYTRINSEVMSNRNTGLNCQIRGILDNGEVVPLSPSESIEEANMNNREIVITCTVK